MRLKLFDEPNLMFGRGESVCPKAGIETLGVYDLNDELRKSELRVGLVGRQKGLDELNAWLKNCQSFIDGKESKLSNLFRGFGGFSDTHGFYCKLLYGNRSTRAIENSKITAIQETNDLEKRISLCVDIYFEEIRFLSENRPVDVIVCALPDELFASITSSTKSEGLEEDIAEDRQEDDSNESVTESEIVQSQQGEDDNEKENIK